MYTWQIINLPKAWLDELMVGMDASLSPLALSTENNEHDKVINMIMTDKNWF